MSDRLHRFLFEQAAIRGEIVSLDASFRAILARHDYPAVLHDLLGEFTAGAALLAATIKFEGALIIQAQGTGPVQLLVVECTSDGSLRALAQSDATVEPAPLRQLLGDARLAITIDPREGAQRYQGIVEVGADSTAAAIEHYLERSEQLPTRLWLAVGPERAAGLLLQRLPGQDPDEDAWNRVTTLAATITSEELLTLEARALLHRLFHEEDVRLFDPQPLHFRCTCSRERVVRALRMIGPDEVHALLKERGEIETHCEFCNQRYVFDPVDAEQIFAAAVQTPTARTRH